MRALCMGVAIIVAAPLAFSQAAEPDAATTTAIQVDNLQSLKLGLLALAQERLQPAGLIVDAQRAWLSLSGPLPSAGMLEVRPTWPADTQAPPMPLVFELRPTLRAGVAAGRAAESQPLRATLAVPLLREVWTANRRLRKGSAITCADLGLQRRDMRDMPKSPLALPCEIGPGEVALRDIAASDVVRSTDIGRAPEVAAGTLVRVSVQTNGISVSTTAIALADARVGDRIDVRLPRTTRVLSTRVTGPGRVELQDISL